jgi:outer membrane protein assembly factor BamB
MHCRPHLSMTLLCLACTMACIEAAAAPVGGGPVESWSRWRGAAGAGQGGDAAFPREWSDADWAWTADLPGQGNASPVVRGGLIYTASADEAAGKRFITGHDLATGRLVWKREFAGPIDPHHAQNSSASGSLAAGPAGVYWMWGTRAGIHVEALTPAGEPLWHVDLGSFAGDHGFGATPALCGEVLVVPNDQDGASFVVGLDARTGRERWRLPRESRKAGYATPLVIEGGAAPLVVLASMAHGLTAIDPATGAVLWERRCLPKRAVSSPLQVGGLFVATCGDGGGDNTLVAVRPPPRPAGGPAGGPEPEIAYQLDRSVAPYVPTPVACEGRLYLWGDRGVVTCVDAATGETVWRGRVGGNFSASPIVVGGGIVNVSQDGEVVTIAAGPAFEVLGRAALGAACRATPAVVGERMIFRSAGRLHTLDAIRPQ